MHSDAQRKEVRLKWLGGEGVEPHDPLQPEDTHVDIDRYVQCGAAHELPVGRRGWVQ